MVKRKGAGYMIEIITSILIIFGFILGNVPADPGTDWSNFQKEIAGQDITYTLEKTGDANSFVREGGTGSYKTAAQTLMRSSTDLSGSISNVPIDSELIGFNTIQSDRLNASLDTVSNLNDQCSQNNDLQELDSEYEVLRTENKRGDSYIYVADSDPSVSGGSSGETDYDTVWVDNGTKCQFSSSEGPHYLEEIIYWGDGSGHDYWDINGIYGSERELELFKSTQMVRLRPEIESRMNGINTKNSVDAMAADKEELDRYDIIVFRKRETLQSGVLNTDQEKIEDYMSDGSILLMMNLKRSDFYDGSNLDDNFIVRTGLKWVDLSYKSNLRNNPGDSIGGKFGESNSGRNTKTFYQGLDGDKNNLDINPDGDISSSNNRYFKNSDPILSSERGAYYTDDWNATNYSMKPVDPSNIDNYPETACVEPGVTDGNLTIGSFEFTDYETDSTVEYTVISTKLGKNETVCKNRNVRAINIDLDGDDNFGGENEGPFLNGSTIEVNDKQYTVIFPNKLSRKNGYRSDFKYSGNQKVEIVNYRTSFMDYKGEKLARMGYKSTYSQDERKLISSIIHWLSKENTQFGEDQNSQVTTESVGSVKEETLIPYKISLRWN